MPKTILTCRNISTKEMLPTGDPTIEILLSDLATIIETGFGFKHKRACNMGEIKDVVSIFEGRNLSDIIFVETGTYIGDSAKLASTLGFKKVYTIELQGYLYDKAKDNLS